MSYDDDPTEIIWTSPARHEQEPRRVLGVRAPAAVAGLATATVIGSVIGLALAGAEPTSLDLPPDAPTLTAPALPAPAGTTPARRSPVRPTARPTPRTVPTVTVRVTSPTTSANVPVVITPRPPSSSPSSPSDTPPSDTPPTGTPPTDTGPTDSSSTTPTDSPSSVEES